jgi:endo-1,3-1,4-beta-glycanase ExoK
VTRCRLIALFCAVVCAGIMAAPARSSTRPAWTATAHALGRGVLDPANVAITGGRVTLALPAGRTDGGEVRSVATERGGSYEARIRVANAPSSITGFFLYAPPDFASEIDIEILNDPTGTILFTTYAGGRETHHEKRSLGFDPTAAAHDYRIDWERRSAGFAVDGRVLRRWTTGIPTAPMNLYLNAWFPRWLGGIAPPATAFTTVDRVTKR